ncbi:hypothetical protein P170DRAFT_476577 [Aspergillus steynii IBT 23096]|uniref:Aminoglycoside phosphotransferase domain-containing protein n=1 Tax=Aspergillus steynii IBT 23096 TaxID=1392250 RepID=A0A2I2G4X3_9EURO|nr:uncharacterized protein P170DRAFT_476577 [Aspergillus steynii IBT 23096]PLB47924.1 hypothetical protein P170DRAFT_476577 [Aspergillus steynii IBT 23096]
MEPAEDPIGRPLVAIKKKPSFSETVVQLPTASSTVEGEVLLNQWDMLSATEAAHARNQIRRAIAVLRRIPALCTDAGKHNILYSRKTQAVTMIDFERARPCDEIYLASQDPEMYDIFDDGPEA